MQTNPDYPTSFIIKTSLILGALGMFAPVGTDMYLAGIVSVANDFHADVSRAQLTLSVYFLGLAVGQVLYGPVTDRFGRRWPLAIGVVLFTVSSLSIAIAPTIESVIALRLFQAVGGCSGMIIGRAVVHDLFDFRQSARIYATLGVVQGLAPILAPVVGGFILARWGWRATFVCMGVFGFACLAATIFGLRESLPQDARRRVNLPQIARDYWELACHRPFMAPALAGAVAGCFLFAYICASPYVFMTIFGVSKTQYTIIFASNMVGTILAAQLNRRLSHKRSPRWLFIAGLLYALTTTGVLALIAGRASMFVFMVPLWLTIAALPMLFANSTAMAMRSCCGKAGVASALLGLVQFGLAGIISAVASAWRDGTPAPMAWLMFGSIALGLAIFLIGSPPEPQEN